MTSPSNWLLRDWHDRVMPEPLPVSLLDKTFWIKSFARAEMKRRKIRNATEWMEGMRKQRAKNFCNSFTYCNDGTLGTHWPHYRNQIKKVKAYWLHFYLPPDGHMPCPVWQHMDSWAQTKAWAARTRTHTHTHTNTPTHAYVNERVYKNISVSTLIITHLPDKQIYTHASVQHPN